MVKGVQWLLVLVSLLILSLAACTMAGGADTADTTRDDLAAQLTAAQAAQAEALNLWDRVIFGEQVLCTESIPVPEPVMLAQDVLQKHADAGAIQDRLNTAIRSLRAASDLWNIECGEDRPYVPLDMAREGRAVALAARISLDEAAVLLAAWEQ